MLGEPLKWRFRLCNPTAAARWQWRNFPPLWGTFFSFQPLRGPRKKTLLSSFTQAGTHQSRLSGGRVTVCVCVCGDLCLWWVFSWLFGQVSYHVSAHTHKVFIVRALAADRFLRRTYLLTGVVALWILQVVINFHTNMKIHTLAKHTVTRVLVLNGTEVALWSLLIIYLCRMLPKRVLIWPFLHAHIYKGYKCDIFMILLVLYC